MFVLFLWHSRIDVLVQWLVPTALWRSIKWKGGETRKPQQPALLFFSPLSHSLFFTDSNTTMFSGKFLAIIVSVLAIAVNGSPVEVAERDLQAVRPLCVVPPGLNLQSRVIDVI